MNRNEIEIRNATTNDVGRIVEVHLQSFPGFFLTRLGPSFLRLFYRGLVELNSGILIVSLNGDRIVGLVGGTDSQESLYPSLFRSGRVRFILVSARAAIAHPTALGRLFRAHSRSRGKLESRPGAALMSLAVHPQSEGQGSGTLLVSAFEDVLRARGVLEYSLTTDERDNERVNGFYLGRGMKLDRLIVTPEGRRLNEYVMKL
ncbi:GNAT family N-acetyltransferase [Paramicrobacterium fandaimingii]|uniref:GNAT family N-acetyltransferase n=1 Tax=Paramicrobacterium fandaimingii TaxID=2708079 RepID=UPI00141EF4D5